MHGDFLKKLGGATVIAEWLSEHADSTVDREAIYKWAGNGVPWKWRLSVARMAKERGVKTPDGFLRGAA